MRSSRFVGVILGLCAVALPLPAARLFGTTGVGSTTSTLVELNPTTGALVQTIGSVGFAVNGLTYDAVTGKLFGSVRQSGGLIEINLTTGAGTLIGSGWNIVADGDNPVLLASNSTGQVYSWLDPSNDDLLLVNTAAGTVSLVGEAGIGTGAHGIAFDGSDVLWLVNGGGEIFTLNTTTGAATSVGSLGQTAHHGDFDPVSGLYYGINGIGTGAKSLILANLVSQTFSTLTTVDDLHALTFIPDATGVPEPSSWAMLGVGLAFAAWRRRRLC